MDAINLIDVGIAAFVGVLFQGLWYSSIFFGNLWKKLTNQTQTKHIAWKFFFSFFLLCVISFFIALIQAYIGATSFWDGVISGIVIWIGFVVPVNLFAIIWGKKNVGAFLIDQGCWFFVFVLMGTVLAG